MNTFKKNFLVFLATSTIIACLSFASLFFTHPSSAAETYSYTPMESVPGFEDKTTFPSFVGAIISFAIWTVGLASLFMIMWGGFVYMTSAGNVSRAETGKRIIFDAFFGLFIVLTAYLLLYVINPDLVKIKMTFSPVPAVPSKPLVPAPKLEIPAGEAIDKILKISSGEGSCRDEDKNVVSPRRNLEEIKQGKPMTACNHTCFSNKTPCTRSVSPASNLLSSVLCASEKASFTITSIAGGQHSPKSNHYVGRAVDIVTNSAENYEKARLAFLACGTRPRCEKGSIAVPCSQADHIHVDL